jgi:hypothetical protein
VRGAAFVSGPEERAYFNPLADTKAAPPQAKSTYKAARPGKALNKVGAVCLLGRTANKDNCDLDHCRGVGNCHNWGWRQSLELGGTDEKARVGSRTYSHVKDARTQKKASGRNCVDIEKDRGGDATKGF